MIDDNRYLIPANANRGKLILGYFRPLDLVIFLIGVISSFSLLVIFQYAIDNVWIALGCASPGLLSLFLVMPIPNYHNTLVVLQELFRFLTIDKEFKWEGWCFKNGKE